MRVSELAAALGTAWEGDGEREITGVATLEDAGETDLSFADGRKAAAEAGGSRAGCLIVPPDLRVEGRPLIRAKAPRTLFAKAVALFHPPAPPRPGIHPSAVIAATATIGAGASIGPHAVIGENTVLGDGCVIGPGCAIGRDVEIGAGCVFRANVTVYDRVRIGRQCILHSGAVIGADGFGFVFEGGRHEKFPQVGTVEIGDFVEIGAQSCVDRAALGKTVVGEGTKLDNMVHVGHNCRIGKHVLVVAQTGFAGGVEIGDYAIIGGQVGVGDKARIESGAVVGSGAGILTSKIVRAGEPVWGTPARPLRQYLEQLAHLGRLPKLRQEMAELRQRLKEK